MLRQPHLDIICNGTDLLCEVAEAAELVTLKEGAWRMLTKITQCKLRFYSFFFSKNSDAIWIKEIWVKENQSVVHVLQCHAVKRNECEAVPFLSVRLLPTFPLPQWCFHRGQVKEVRKRKQEGPLKLAPFLRTRSCFVSVQKVKNF